MARKIVIVTIEGYSASLRSEGKTLSTPFNEVRAEFETAATVVHHQFHSSDPGVVRKAACCLLAEKTEDGLYIIGKSLGGVKAFRVYKRICNKIAQHRRVSLVLIDAHSPFPTFYGPYRKIKIKTKHANTKVWNVYQRNKYPRGAYVQNADLNLCLVDGTDHWNIIFKEETKELYRRGFEWLLQQP